MAYIRNLKKSFKYLVKDLSEDYAPNTTNAGKAITRTIQDSKKFYNKSGSMNSLKNQIMNTPIFKDIDRSTKKYFEDIKKGNIYKGKDAGFDEQFGLSNMNDMIYDDEGEETPMTETSESSGVTNVDTTSPDKDKGLMSKLRQGSSVRDSIQDNETPEAVIDSNEALALSLGDVMKSLHIDNKIAMNVHFDKLDGKIDTINDNLTTLVKFNDEIQKDFIEKTTKFYEDHMGLMNEIRSILQDNIVVENRRNDNMNQNMIQKGIMDHLRVGDYKNAGQSAFFKIANALDPSGSLSTMGSLAPMMMQEYIANPSLIFKDVIKGGLNKFLGFDVIEKADSLFDKAKSGKNSIFNKMSLSDNKFVKMVGNAFRDKGDINRNIETGNYNKGRTFFDGITKKAITEVIPTYLRKILSTLSGNEELVFNYDSGQYKKMSEVAENFYNMRPDFKGQYERITNLVEKNLDKERVGEVDSKALEDTMKKITDNLLDRSYTLDDLSVMKYNKFMNMTGMGKDELSRSEYQLIRNALMNAKTGTDQSSASDFRDIQNAMGNYNVQMSDYYKEQSRNAHMTGVSALANGSFKSQSYGISGIGDGTGLGVDVQGRPIPKDKDKRNYKTLSEYDPTKNRGDLSEIGVPFDVNMTEEQKRVLNESYDKFNTLDYVNSSLMGITNLPFLEKIGVNDIKEIKEWKEKNPYDLDNIMGSGGKNIDELHDFYLNNKFGKILKGTNEQISNITGSGKEKTTEINEKVKDEVTEQLSKGISNIFNKVNKDSKSNSISDAINKTKEKGWDVFKDYKPNLSKGIDIGSGALGGIGIGAVVSTLLTGSPFMGTFMSTLFAAGGGFLSQSSKIKSKLFGEKNKDKTMVRNISEKFFGKERTDKLHQSILSIYDGFKEKFLSPLGDWFKRTFKKPMDWVKGKLGFGNKDETKPEDENIEQTEEINMDEIDNEVKKDDEGGYGQGINRFKNLYSKSSEDSMFGKGIHYFSQSSGDYSSLPLVGSTVGKSGCGLLSAAMAISNILDTEIKPDELVNIAKKYKVKNDGISFGFFRDVGHRFEIPTNIFSREEISLNALDSTISSGAMVVALYEDRSGSLHYVLVRKGRDKHFSVDDPIRGSNLQIPKFLIYAKTRDFIVFYPDNISESKPRDAELKNSNSIKDFFRGIIKDNSISEKISNSKLVKSITNLSGKVSTSTMDKIIDDVKKEGNVIDIGDRKKKEGDSSSGDGDGENESAIKKYTKRIIRKQEELLNGVAYNLEYIKRLLVSHFGDLDSDMKPDKEGVFGGILKKKNKFILKIKNFFGDLKDRIMSPFENIGEKIKNAGNKIKEIITKPIKFFKNLSSKIKDILPSKEEVKEKWDMFTNKIKDLSETLQIYRLEFKDKLKDFGETAYLYGLEFKDKLKEFAKKTKDASIEFMKDMKKKASSAWEKWKEDIYPSVKESLKDWKEKGKEFFNSAKDIIKSGASKIWGGMKKAGRWGWEKIKGVRSIFSDKIGALSDKVFKKKIQKVYVEGGHLDTVGAIGGTDIDYFREVRDKSEKKENSNSKDKDIDYNSIPHAKVLDKYQDVGTPAEERSIGLLKKIAGKKFSGGSGTKSEGGVFDTVKDYLMGAGAGASIINTLKDKVKGGAKNVAGGIGNKIQNLKIGGKMYFDQFKNFVSSGGIGQTVSNAAQGGKAILSSGWNKMGNLYDAGKSYVHAAGGSIAATYASIKAGVSSILAAGGSAALAIKGILVGAASAIGLFVGLFLCRFVYDDVDTMGDAWKKFKKGLKAIIDPKTWEYIGQTIKDFFGGGKSELESMIAMVQANEELTEEEKKKVIARLMRSETQKTEEEVIEKLNKDVQSKDKKKKNLNFTDKRQSTKISDIKENKAKDVSLSGSGLGSLTDGRFINQRSSKYNDLYVGGQKFSENGCAPSVMSMLLSNYGEDVPMESLVKETRFYSDNDGVKFEYFKDMVNRYNMNGNIHTKNIPNVMDTLDEHNQAVLLTKANNGNDHYVLVKKSNGKLMLYDPLNGNEKIISKNSNLINNASLAYVIKPSLNEDEMSESNTFQNRVGAGLGAKVDLLTGQNMDKINSLISKQRMDQINKIRNLKDRVQLGRQIEREINNTFNNSTETRTESLTPIKVDNSSIENKLDTMITEIRNLAKVFAEMGKEIVSNNNTNNNVVNNKTENVQGNENTTDRSTRDAFIKTMNKISSGVLAT